MKISDELTEKYLGYTLTEALNDWGESNKSYFEFYQSFLNTTDHIPNKIVEAQVLGKKAENYIEILKARDFARSEINRLQTEVM